MGRQTTFALAAGFEKHQKVTRRAEFLGAMNTVVPWRELCAEVEPFYEGRQRPSTSGAGTDAADLLPPGLV